MGECVWIGRGGVYMVLLAFVLPWAESSPLAVVFNIDAGFADHLSSRPLSVPPQMRQSRTPFTGELVLSRMRGYVWVCG